MGMAIVPAIAVIVTRMWVTRRFTTIVRWLARDTFIPVMAVG